MSLFWARGQQWGKEGENGFQHPVLCNLPASDNPGQLHEVLMVTLRFGRNSLKSYHKHFHFLPHSVPEVSGWDSKWDQTCDHEKSIETFIPSHRSRNHMGNMFSRADLIVCGRELQYVQNHSWKNLQTETCHLELWFLYNLIKWNHWISLDSGE